MMVPPPMWSNNGGGNPNFSEQGVYSDLGNYMGGAGGGPQKMKMVGFSPFVGSDGESGLGFQPWLGGEQPMYEGKHGLAQCGVNPSTGETMTDASGKARCWTIPVASGSNFVGGGTGGAGAWIGDNNIAHYNVGVPALGAGLLGGLGVSLLVFVGLFAYRVYITRRVNKGDEPGILGKLVMPENWKIWGNKYHGKRTSKVYGAMSEADGTMVKMSVMAGISGALVSGIFYKATIVQSAIAAGLTAIFFVVATLAYKKFVARKKRA